MKHHISDHDAGADFARPLEKRLPSTPENLPRRARVLLRDLVSIMDARTGEVPAMGRPPSAMTTMVAVTGSKRRNVEQALRVLKEAELVTTFLEPGSGATGQGCLRVIVVGALRIEGTCESCGELTHGTGRWCKDCKQRLRTDREWQTVARFLSRRGVEPPRIAALVGRPLFVASQDDGRAPNGGAVVPFLLGQGELGGEWAERLREATRSHVDE